MPAMHCALLFTSIPRSIDYTTCLPVAHHGDATDIIMHFLKGFKASMNHHCDSLRRGLGTKRTLHGLLGKSIK